MKSINMCRGTGCPDKNFCYRHMAIPHPTSQTFMSDVPYDHEDKMCKIFWRLRMGDEIREVSE